MINTHIVYTIQDCSHATVHVQNQNHLIMEEIVLVTPKMYRFVRYLAHQVTDCQIPCTSGNRFVTYHAHQVIDLSDNMTSGKRFVKYHANQVTDLSDTMYIM